VNSSTSPLPPGLFPSSLKVQRQMIVILDFGSQYSELIARRIRETHVYSEILSYRTTAEQLRQLRPQGIILSGGPNSVYEPGAPACDLEIWNLGIPILGVCYGMQLMVQQLGGKVEPAQKGEYGRAALHILDPTDLLTNLPESSIMWMSHGDSVTELPPGFHSLAYTDNTLSSDAWPRQPKNQLVLIGQHLDTAKLRQKLEACLVPAPVQG